MRKLIKILPITLVAIAAMLSAKLQSQNTLYWVDGTGMWSDASHWAASSGGAGGAGVPDDQTNVVFDRSSFSGIGDMVEIDLPTAQCNDMNWENSASPLNPVLDGAAGNTLKIHGSLTLLGSMQVPFQGDIYFSATDSNNTIDINDLVLDNQLVFESSGKWTLTDEIRTRSRIDIRKGFIDADEFEILCAQIYSDYTTPRALDITDAIVQASKKGNTWYVNGDNLDLKAASSFIILHDSMPEMINLGTDTLHFSGVFFADTFSNARLSFGDYFQVLFSGDGVLERYNNIDSLYFTPGKTYEITTDYTQFINSGWFSIGANCYPIKIHSTNPGTQATLELGNAQMSFEHNLIRDLDVNGTGNFNAGMFSTDKGNNTGLTFGQANLVYSNVLGNDTLLCIGDTKTLATRYYWETAERRWQDNSTGRTYTVSSPGEYHVRMTFFPGCFLDDTIRVDYSDVTVDLGPDTILCKGEQLVLNTSAKPTWNVTWEDGSSANDLTVTGPGTYSVTVQDTNGCAVRDSVLITEEPPPLISLPGDTAICEGDSIVLQPNPDPTLNFVWQDGSTNPTFVAKNTGNYRVTVTNDIGCSNDSGMQLTVYPKPSVLLGNDVSICENDNVVLDVNVSNSTYSWNTGATSKSITVDEAGNYSVTVTDKNGCQDQDDINISIKPIPEFDIADTALCFERTGPVTFTGPSFVEKYNWSTGDTSRSVELRFPGDYSLEVTSSNNCSYTDVFEIANDCETAIIFPTAFTPNGDGVNDRLTTKTVNVRSARYRIYNRWGELIFVTEDEYCNWAGQMNGTIAPVGMYVVIATGIDNFGIPFERRENVLILK